MTTKNELATTQQATLGQALVNEAKERLRKENQEAFQASVNEVIRNIDECERTIRIGKAGLVFFKDRKKALEAGEFSLHPFRKTLVYNEARLNGNYQEDVNNFR